MPGVPSTQWWPHPALTAEWVHDCEADIVHLHFGFEHLTAHEAQRWASAVHAQRIALVLTVHDLVNPHLGPSTEYDALLDVFVPAADVVTTLTRSAAAEIAQRWGVRAAVIPHPPVVDALSVTRPRPEHSDWIVTVHAKSLRPSFDVTALQRATDAIDDLPGSSLRLHVHDDVLDPTHPRHDPRLLALLDRVDARVHPPLSDEDLWSDLLDTDLSLLPYRYGTHSGWVEMCHDLATDVLVADVGHIREQHSVRLYRDDPSEALLAAFEDHRAGFRPSPPRHRPRERERIQSAYAAIYAELGGRR